MDNPFYYGDEVSRPYFFNRKKELHELVHDLARGQNVIMYSPRRYGKTSLIKQVLLELEHKGLLTYYINLYAATSKKKFADIYAKSIAKGTKGKLESILAQLKTLIPRMLPKIIVKEEGLPEFEFDYSAKPNSLSPILDDVYEAVEKYARSKSKRAVVVFDEFQEILNFEDDEIERTLRGIVQSHKKTAYVFMGSRRHMMIKLFNDVTRPFYKSGKMYPLNKIGLNEFKEFITEKFRQAKISCDGERINEMLAITECHPYYTQMLCSVLWDRNSSSRIISHESIRNAVDELIARESYAYTTIWDGITSERKRLLEALARGNGEKIYSQKFKSSFDVGSHPFIQKSIHYFVEQGIIFKENDCFTFSDIFFKQWILKKIAT